MSAESTTPSVPILPLQFLEGGDDIYSLFAAIETPDAEIAQGVEAADRLCRTISIDPALGRWDYALWPGRNESVHTCFQVLFTPYDGDIIDDVGSKCSPWVHKTEAGWVFFGIGVQSPLSREPVACFCVYDAATDVRSLWYVLPLNPYKLAGPDPLALLIAALPESWANLPREYTMTDESTDEEEGEE